MTQVLFAIGFMFLAILIFAGGLHFSQYKKRANAGCCGGGHCESGGDAHSCYSSKTDFVDNLDRIKTEKMEARS